MTSDPEPSCLDNYPIHTITGLVKRWLRELPDPLMTFSLYNDFLRAAGELALNNIKKRSPEDLVLKKLLFVLIFTEGLSSCEWLCDSVQLKLEYIFGYTQTSDWYQIFCRSGSVLM